MSETLVWAAAVFIPLMTGVIWLAPAARRAIDAWGSAHQLGHTERRANAEATLVDVDERRHQLAVGRETIEQEVGRERARLATETAQYETDAEAARGCLEPAVAARTRALEARAEAEAELAPEMARKALGDGGSLAVLAQAYAAYCANCTATPWSFDHWIGSFEGLSR